MSVHHIWNPFYGAVGNKGSSRDIQMNEMVLLLLAVVGVISVACSFALIALGKMVDEFPSGNETSRTRGITSPVESTKIAVVLFWIMFLPGAWAVLQEGIVTVIIGITLLFAICLFLLTALIFSFQVLGTMSQRKNENTDAMMGVHTPPPAVSGSSSPAPVESVTKGIPRKKSLAKSLFHSLLKK
jgi:hypothetical protein